METFGCCSRYKECSKAGSCVQTDEMYEGCYYKKNLAEGKNFYYKGGKKVFKYAVIDIETTGLSRYDNEITFVGIGCANEIGEPLKYKFYSMILDNSRRLLKEALEEFRHNKTKLIFQNGKFDTLFLHQKGFPMLPIHWDIMVMGTAHELNTAHGLKAMAKQYLGIEDWDISKKDKTSIDFEKVKPYLKKDVQYTWELFCFFFRALSAKNRKIYTKLLFPAYLLYRRVEKKGIYIDLTALEKIKKVYKKAQLEKEAVLKAQHDINWNSSKQVADVLFTVKKLPTLKLSSKTGAPSADTKVLGRLAQQGHELPKQLMEYKFYYGANTKFLNHWGDYASYDGRIHPSFNITNVITGRTSCSDPNLQQVPRRKELRTLFTAPAGRVLLEADYSQIELRVAAHMANESTMLRIYREGGDIHTSTAASVMGKPEAQVSKEDRNKAKAVIE